VKAAARQLGLPVTDALDEVLAVGAELGVVVAYGRIIPGSVLDQLPMVNLHFSLLPRWRGAAPVERAILEGDAETGVCLMAVEAGLDTGGIYAECGTVIGDDETADELRARLVAMGCRLLEEHLTGGIAGLPVPRDQNGRPSYAEKVLSSEHEIHWDQPAVQVRRVIRLGRAWTTFRGRRLRVLRAAGAPIGTAVGDAAAERATVGPAGGVGGRGVPGSLEGPTVVTGGGAHIRLVTVQPEGRRPLAVQDWLRGVRPEPGERLGL
jgi:methionyl-tRNA formyltransferase